MFEPNRNIMRRIEYFSRADNTVPLLRLTVSIACLDERVIIRATRREIERERLGCRCATTTTRTGAVKPRNLRAASIHRENASAHALDCRHQDNDGTQCRWHVGQRTVSTRDFSHVALHFGHVGCVVDQSMMHDWWKPCPHVPHSIRKPGLLLSCSLPLIFMLLQSIQTTHHMQQAQPNQ